LGSLLPPRFDFLVLKMLKKCQARPGFARCQHQNRAGIKQHPLHFLSTEIDGIKRRSMPNGAATLSPTADGEKKGQQHRELLTISSNGGQS
jgi:hypothetical protein